MDKAIWECKIGEVGRSKLPDGADHPMREAVEAAYEELTGEKPDFNFSGWGARLTDVERAVVNDDEDAAIAALSQFVVVETYDNGELRVFGPYEQSAAKARADVFGGSTVSSKAVELTDPTGPGDVSGYTPPAEPAGA